MRKKYDVGTKCFVTLTQRYRNIVIFSNDVDIYSCFHFVLFTGHPNVKLFISHGGLLGTQEAVACGVPMLIVPLYADQALNARAMYDRAVAQIINLNDADKSNWRTALHELLGNEKLV